MSKVIFPIKSDKSCLLKWAWSSVYFNSGTSSSCHRTQKYQINLENFNSFHNLPDKIAARKLMLAGQWPGAGCEYCKKVEDAGGISDRMFQLQQLNDEQLVPPELHENNTAVDVSPTILEVYFKNTCNMACIYCGPHFSSRWEDENRRHDFLHELTNDKFSVLLEQHNPNYDKMVSNLWDFLKTDNNARNIQRYHILGGEPFLMSELDSSIAFWARYGHQNLQFSIVTNLNIPHERFKSYIKKFELLAKKKKIWRLQLTASLDCWGTEQEYVRYGLDFNLWKKNFEYLLNKSWIYPSINSVISALTIKSLPQLIEQINKYNLNQQDVIEEFRIYSNSILHSFNTSSLIDDPYIFSGEVFKDAFDAALQMMPTDSESQIGQKQMMLGIANISAQSHNDTKRIEKLKNYLGQLDSRRGTNWKENFPWLEQIKT